MYGDIIPVGERINVTKKKTARFDQKKKKTHTRINGHDWAALRCDIVACAHVSALDATVTFGPTSFAPCQTPPPAPPPDQPYALTLRHYEPSPQQRVNSAITVVVYSSSSSRDESETKSKRNASERADSSNSSETFLGGRQEKPNPQKELTTKADRSRRSTKSINPRDSGGPCATGKESLRQHVETPRSKTQREREKQTAKSIPHPCS